MFKLVVLSEETTPSLDESGLSKTNSQDKNLSKVRDSSKKAGIPILNLALMRLYQALASTLVLDVGLICYQIYTTHNYAVGPLLLAKTISWIALTSNWTRLRSGATNGGTRVLWFDHAFVWITLAGSTFLARPILAHAWGVIASRALLQTKPKLDPWAFLPLTEDIFERIQLGIFAIRYTMLWAASLFSALHLSGALDISDLNVSEALFKDPLSSDNTATKAKIAPSNRKTLAYLEEREKEEADAFKNFWAKAKLAIRLSYPWGEKRLRLRILIKLILVIFNRAVNVLVPLQTERILRSFTQDAGGSVTISKFDAWSVVMYVLYKYLQENSGIFFTLQRHVLAPMEEHTRMSITLRFFEHLHNMSMQFHLDHRPSDLMHMAESAPHIIQSVSDMVLFGLLPNIADIVIAIFYFWTTWGWKYGFIVIFNSMLYIALSAYSTRKRIKARRGQGAVGDGGWGKAMGSFQNSGTVKHFTAESFEAGQYRKSLETSQITRFHLTMTTELLNMLESFAWTLNSLAGCMLCATFAMLERALNFLEQEQTVKDIPGAEPLVVTGGEIVFDDVSFQYDANKAGLKNISFTVPGGKTVALVGPTGSGKSTVLRLVLRLWDPTSGRILIDGQNIAERTQLSVRNQIGFVSQESALFDDSIAYNIHYGRVDAPTEDIQKAGEAAQIHESILKFQDGYETMVGESGGKLSGGEKQRISLARTILKNAPILLLDEATSALDTITESKLQAALTAMTKDRTTIVVAHRLSTVMNADMILCLKDGVIVERGTHAELVQKGMENDGEGEYYKMWKVQSGGTALSSLSTP
ncbi:ATP-binding cassette sub- B member 6, mitochondrial [Gamsiella multidivaricata]|nr:ATP-binding cassette sub- B member 6, mitochondrial [Gamsiella multidivaricata]